MNAIASPLPTDPAVLRPLLHKKLDEASPEELDAANRLLLELELDEVSERLNAGFDGDRAAGKLERLPEIIQAARAELRKRKAP